MTSALTDLRKRWEANIKSPAGTLGSHTVFPYHATQDRYVPFHCARITTCVAAQRDARKGPIYHEMVAALLRGTEGAAGGTAAAAAPAEPTAVGDLVPLPPTQLFRVDVDFDLQVRRWVALGRGEVECGRCS